MLTVVSQGLGLGIFAFACYHAAVSDPFYVLRESPVAAFSELIPGYV